MKKIIYTIFLALAIVGCKPSEIGTFGEERFIYFNPEKEYEYNYSFLYAKGKDEVDLVIPIKYAGRLYNDQKEYKVIAGEGSTAVENTDFRLAEKMSFKGASYEDQLVVTLLKTDAIKDKKLDLILEFVTNENFQARSKIANKYKITFTSMITKPSWWDEEIDQFYLGEYSDKKFELFVHNIYDGDYGALSSEEKLQFAQSFKAWLAAHPEDAMDNGTLITVPV